MMILYVIAFNLHMTLTHIDECCNQIKIQSDGPASVGQPDMMGDYEKEGNVYRNIMNSVQFFYKDSNGRWMVCEQLSLYFFQ